MKASIESTNVVTTFNGAECRVWKGMSAQGVPFVAFISAVSVGVAPMENAAHAEFIRDLNDMPAPTEMTVAEVLFFILDTDDDDRDARDYQRSQPRREGES
jgi:hypothetical protein